MIAYFSFGMCLICGACVLICANALHEWNHSEQKAHEEYWRFKYYMHKLDIDKESEREVISKIHSIEEFSRVNKQLKRLTAKM